MKKTIALCISTALLFCVSISVYSQGLNEREDVIDDDVAVRSESVLPAAEEYDETTSADGASDVKEQIEKHLALFEYGKAALLIEENERICSHPSFNRAKNDIIIHFTEIAEGYYQKAISFLKKQKRIGNDVDDMFDGSGNLIADNLEDILSAEEKTAMNRVVISRATASDGIYIDSIDSVSIELFGEYAVYPVQDITLEPEVLPTGEYTDSKQLLEEVRKNMSIRRYNAAVQLMEENPELAADNSFYDIKTELLEYFSDKARRFTGYAITHAASQEKMGYPLTDGCEGYDAKSHTLDPLCLSYLLSSEEKDIVYRVKIVCNNEEAPGFRVIIDFCGMTAQYQYPAQMPPVSEEYEAQYNYETAFPDGTSDIKEQTERLITRSEYGRAAQLIEENEQLCADPYFDSIKNEILIYYTETAKSYYQKAASFLRRQRADGNDIEAIFDENGNLTAGYLEDMLTAEEKTIMDRVVISRGTVFDGIESDRIDSIDGVSIELFGEYAVYPAQDIISETVTTPTGEYTDKALLLGEVQKNIRFYRYAAAVQLMEENPVLAADSSFDSVKTQLLEYFTDTARRYMLHTITHITYQETAGYPLTDGCEGYDTETRTLDPACLSYLLTHGETAVMKRVKIVCNNEEFPDFGITVDFCGMTAQYPAEDIMM